MSENANPALEAQDLIKLKKISLAIKKMIVDHNEAKTIFMKVVGWKGEIFDIFWSTEVEKRFSEIDSTHLCGSISTTDTMSKSQIFTYLLHKIQVLLADVQINLPLLLRIDDINSEKMYFTIKR